MTRGVVTKSTGSLCTVRTEQGEEIACGIRGKLRTKGIRSTNPVAVGDAVELEEENGVFRITRIGERRNYLIRKSTNLSKESHILAANVDQAMILVTINHPETSTVFIDRFLVTAEAYRIPAVVIFNKTDLYTPAESNRLEELSGIYTAIGYPCHAVSVLENRNIEAIRQVLQGKTTVISGISGVGKSSLINAVEPELKLKTASISLSHDTGRHTTTFAEMFTLRDGGAIIDTPGIRSFGMIDMKREEISHYFPEIFRYAAECRFYNCTHLHEPGCAVVEAIRQGAISESRYFSYLSLMEEDGKYR